MSEQNTLYSLTAPVVMGHPNLFEARAFGPKNKPNGEAKFSANFLLKPDSQDLAAMKAMCVAIAKAKWPGRDLKTLKFPFTDGNKLAERRKQKSGKDDGEFQRGHVVIAARSKYEPKLSGFENGKVVDYEGDARLKAKTKFFFGAEVLAQVNFQPYDGVGSNPDGVTAYLNMVFSTGKGTKIAGSSASAAEVFRGYAGASTPEDPTAGADMDDNIPM